MDQLIHHLNPTDRQIDRARRVPLTLTRSRYLVLHVRLDLSRPAHPVWPRTAVIEPPPAHASP
jgi:hypothetical protein